MKGKIDYVIIRDPEGGVAKLTNQSPSSRYGVPVLEITGVDIEGDFGPADILDYRPGSAPLYAAAIVVAWGSQHGRNPTERAAARMFLRQWPDGPQIP